MKTFKGLNVPKWKELPICKDVLKYFGCDNHFDCKKSCILCPDNILTLAEYLICNPEDLTSIIVLFGLLLPEAQERLREIWNGKGGKESNMQRFDEKDWYNLNPSWCSVHTYRLDPNWKPENEEDKKDMEAIEYLTKRGKIVEGRIIEGV